MNIWNCPTQPLPRLARLPDTFSAYLQRHNLTLLDAARLAALPSLLIWRVSRWLPISEEQAWILVAALGMATGETFSGFILTTRSGSRPRATHFLV